MLLQKVAYHSQSKTKALNIICTAFSKQNLFLKLQVHIIYV